MQLKVIALWLCVISAGVFGAWGGLLFRQAAGLTGLELASGSANGQEGTGSGFGTTNGNHSTGSSSTASSLRNSGQLQKSETQESISVLIEQADESLAESDYEGAIRILERVAEQSSETPPFIRLKLALCKEALHRDSEALRNYQHLLATSKDPQLKSLAVLGQSRLWTRSGQADVAVESLSREVLTLRDHQQTGTRSRLLHQLGISRTESVFAKAQHDPLDDDVLIHPLPEIVPEEILTEANNPTPNSSDVAGSPEGIRLTLQLESDASGTYVSARIPETTIADLLDQLEAAIGLEVTFDSSLQEVLETRFISVNIDELPVSILLDATLAPLSCRWSQSDRDIKIESISDDENADFNWQLEQARRALQLAVAVGAEHPLTAISNLHLAAIDVRTGSPARAEHLLEATIEADPGMPFRGEAWTNVGKCRLLSGKDNSLAAFYRAIDLEPTGHHAAIAFWNVGRLLLWEDKPRDAIAPLKKGLARSSKSNEIADLAMLLASALLLSGEPFQANEVLKDNAAQFEKASVKNQAAFLASLIRYSRIRDPKLVEQEGATLLRAITNFDLKQAKGKHWKFLAAVAYLELGITDEAVRLSQQAASEWLPCPLLALLEDLCTNRNSEMSRRLLTSEPQTNGIENEQPIDVQALVEMKESGQLEEAYLLSRRILERDDTTENEKQQALQLMGRIHQIRGNHAAAIRCFSGVVPTSLEM